MSKHWVTIFKTGRHTSANGFEKDWTDQDLDRIVTTYNEQPTDSRHDAPAVLGHPTTDGPAYGFFETLKRDGNHLMGLLRDVNADFKQMVEDGLYRKVSPKFDSNFLLKHVGWLGAQAPAVKGLPEFRFNSQDVGEVWDVDVTTNRDGGASPDSTDDNPATEGSASHHQFSSGEVMPNEGKPKDPQKTTENSAGAEGTGSSAATPEKVVSAAEFSEFQKKQEEEQKELRRQLAEQRDKNQTLEFNEFLNSEDLKGRVTPAMKPAAIRIMKSLAESSHTFEFSETDAEGKTATGTRTPLEEFQTMLKGLPTSVSFGEMATDGPSQKADSEFSESDEKELEKLADSVLGGL